MEFNFSPEVSDAFEQRLPVVALESTVIAHGLPSPLNLETALKMEEAVRQNGAVPATIAVLKGVPTIGLSKSELEKLATSENTKKISLRDIPAATTSDENCATTVASTMFFAYRAGIEVFATGGIGGVHRGNENDVSADLIALSSIPMLVVCAGAKVVLDLPKTREWLETYGICVLGWKTNDFPAFYSQRSGLEVDQRVDSFEEISTVIKARDELGISSSVLLTVPVPDSESIATEKLEEWLDEALADAERNKISGKELTPVLLSSLSALSSKQTLASNVSLLINNAKVAAETAQLLDT